MYTMEDFNTEKGPQSNFMQCLLHMIESQNKPDIIRAKSIALVSVMYQLDLDASLTDANYSTFLHVITFFTQI
jgi:hypothetical protein